MTDMPNDRAELREMLARALVRAMVKCGCYDTWEGPGEPEDELWTSFDFHIREQLSALDATGLEIVPREETDEMLQAAIRAEDHGGDGDTWAAKISASPFALKEKTND